MWILFITKSLVDDAIMPSAQINVRSDIPRRCECEECRSADEILEDLENITCRRLVLVEEFR